MTDKTARGAEFEAGPFFLRVTAAEGIEGWSLEHYDSGAEGYCWRDEKIIRLGPEATPYLLLHEVAHIDTCEDEKNQHGPKFFERLRELLDRYLGGSSFSESDRIIRTCWRGETDD